MCQTPDHKVAIQQKTQGEDSYTEENRQDREPKGHVGGGYKIERVRQVVIAGKKHSDVCEENVVDGKDMEDWGKLRECKGVGKEEMVGGS